MTPGEDSSQVEAPFDETQPFLSPASFSLPLFWNVSVLGELVITPGGDRDIFQSSVVKAD